MNYRELIPYGCPYETIDDMNYRELIPYGCPYETIEVMKEAVTKVTDMLTQEDFHGAFQKLLER